MRNCVPLLLGLMVAPSSYGQAYGPADTGQSGDLPIQAYLSDRAQRIDQTFDSRFPSHETWNTQRSVYLQEYFYMMGLSPLPDREPIDATRTGSYQGDGFVVELVHFQSRPGLYVTANVYRPAVVASGTRLPAVLYLCGHAGRGRNGNKAAFQSHGIWFARHGYVCAVIDSLQLSELASFHHGTYREQRWWWHSRGYTPAGVECWNGIRAIDYLTSRDDVDADRIAVTGISGGGAATFWISAADPRVRVSVPVSGMADLDSYVTNRVINGHCDCMFLHNTFQWPWTQIAALIAPRPLLFVNSDADNIFPMDANERIINRLERVYKLSGDSDKVDAFVSVGGHDYRADIRKAVCRFINVHLKNDPSPVTDSEIDLVTGNDDQDHPIAPEKLRVFPTDDDLPRDAINRTIDEQFVPMAKVALPTAGEFDSWKAALLSETRRVALRNLPESIRRAKAQEKSGRTVIFETEPGIRVSLRLPKTVEGQTTRLVVMPADGKVSAGEADAVLETRGVGQLAWTRNNPPNYVERSHVLLGQTVDAGRVWDIVACWKALRDRVPDTVPLVLTGERQAGVLVAYAALVEPEIERIEIQSPMASHMDTDAPQLLNILRVCDIPDAVGMLAPRTVTLVDAPDSFISRVQAIYDSAGASDKLQSGTTPTAR